MRNISDEEVEDIPGAFRPRICIACLKRFLSRNASDCLMILEEAYLAGVDMSYFYAMLLKHFLVQLN